MIATLEKPRLPVFRKPQQQAAQHAPQHAPGQAEAMVDYLRRCIITGRASAERFHAVFLDARRTYLGDTSLGMGLDFALTLRMRDLFSRALSIGASGLIIAHNHPSGDCRPSACDIASTHRLKEVAGALDIELIDHLIITERSAYSMRAGGDL